MFWGWLGGVVVALVLWAIGAGTGFWAYTAEEMGPLGPFVVGLLLGFTCGNVGVIIGSLFED